MYSLKNEKRLQRLTAGLLAGPAAMPGTGDVPKRIKILREVIAYHDWRYYSKNDPLISDKEFDRLFEQLKVLEKAHPELQTNKSPTRSITGEQADHLFTIRHLAPMLSLDSIYNAADLLEWDARVKKTTGLSRIEYCVEPKFDGAGISLVYENDRLIRGVTRGDGAAGEDITQNIRQIPSIPATASFSAYGIHIIEIRGEVVINKREFLSLNKQRSSQMLPPMANPRNAASGALHLLNPHEVADKGLKAILYQVSYHMLKPKRREPAVLQYQHQMLALLSELGFQTSYKKQRTLDGIEKVIDYCKAFEKKRDKLPYEIDGMVIKVNDHHLYDQLGMTSHHPRWAIAYKFTPRQGNSKVRDVIFTVGRTGAITPVARIDPVKIGGVMISSVSLHNEHLIREKDIRILDTVLVERAGDVIPDIVKSITELRDGSERPVVFPTRCPACGHSLQKPAGESTWHCLHINCPAQVKERILHFTGKAGLDIEGLGPSRIAKFYEMGIIKDIPSIYEMDYGKIAGLKGFGKRSAGRLEAAVARSKQQPLFKLISGIGIRYVGKTMAKTLADAAGHLMELKNLSPAALMRLQDLGPRAADSIYKFFHNRDNIHMIEKLERSGLNMMGSKARQPNELQLAR